MTRSSLLRIALVLAGASQLAATDCDHASDAGTRVSTAVHVVFGPFPTVGDPRAVHHLEHFLVGPDGISLGTPRVGTLEGWTGPDTLHLVWKGPATASSAACVARRLASTTVDPTALHAQWSIL